MAMPRPPAPGGKVVPVTFGEVADVAGPPPSGGAAGWMVNLSLKW
eukprot:CAMPEP_0180137922 /NCGR_PEP_ID=MMETSP0986-20121125/12537_1 /TAXON_ID=697907 /ORGANISM="non described non described, Strain CCMP2293" /LENGTH=44 /DNA_ID= /DNA_START= /DNA_END= /DNA_ORIENTATION=